jgi:hypothetical protein
MLTFGWLRLRREPAALALLMTGVALYLCDPLLEIFEQAVKGRGGAILLLERVLEEGVAELGGTCCILFGVLLYSRRLAGEGTPTFAWPSTRILLAVPAGTTILIPVAHAAILRLPPADTGIPENWFPAAALFALALSLMADGRRAAGTVACTLSACFGAGLYGYVGLSDARLLVTMLGTVIAGLLAVVMAQRAARRSVSARHSVH